MPFFRILAPRIALVFACDQRAFVAYSYKLSLALVSNLNDRRKALSVPSRTYNVANLDLRSLNSFACDKTCVRSSNELEGRFAN